MRYLHEFKATQLLFKSIELPVVFIGIPETSISKWMSEGAEQKVIDEKHLNIWLPKVLFGGETSEVMDVAYAEWK